MPKIYTNEELAKTRKRIAALNRLGQGLNNKDVFIDLMELENFMRRAQKNLPEIKGEGSRKRKELLNYLDKAAQAFAKLRNKDVANPVPADQQLDADKNSDLEIALHDLSDLKDVLLTQDDDGRPLLDTVVQYGTDKDKGGYGEKELLGALDNLDRILETGIGKIGEEAEKLRSPKEMARYQKQKVVLALKNDPDARLLAAIIDNPDGQLYEDLKKALSLGWKKDGEGLGMQRPYATLIRRIPTQRSFSLASVRGIGYISALNRALRLTRSCIMQCTICAKLFSFSLKI